MRMRTLVSLGDRHRAYGVKDSYFEPMLLALTDALGEVKCGLHPPFVCTTWRRNRTKKKWSLRVPHKYEGVRQGIYARNKESNNESVFASRKDDDGKGEA